MYPEALIKIKDKVGNVKWEGLYLYGVCIAIGLVACLLVLYFFTKKKGMPSYVQDFIYIVGIIAVAFGFLAAKFYQALYVWIDTGEFDFYGAGITFMGGLVGGVVMFIATYFVLGKFYFKGKRANVHKKYFNMIVLVAPLCITIAHAFGRIGCLFGGCCHGTYLGSEPVSGGLYMLGSVKKMLSSGEYISVQSWGYFVPTQLYEALFLFALFGVLTLLYFKGSNITMHVYLIAYAVWRMIIEFFRGDAARVEDLAGGLTPSQWQSVVFLLVGVAMFVVYKLIKMPYLLPNEGFVGENADVSNNDK